ncbi:MAG: hypothetical protein IPO40_06170 [Fibrobacteres bacterium]|nr:hypothetical protein [Fibrobacterota bacterium]
MRRTLVTGESTDMVYDGWREIQSSSSAGEKVIRVWGEYLDEEVVEFRTKSGVTTTRYLLAGNNWNTEAQTDESGNITRTYLVDPFGTFKVYNGAGVDGKWFTTDDVVGDPATLEGERVLQGLPWYGSTGLYHLRNRWYSPTLQRFLSMDPLGFDAGDANLYRFEGNDPLGNLDPMGANVWTPEFQDQVFWTGVSAFATGVAIGAVVTLASPAIATAFAVVGVAMLVKTGIDMGVKGYQAYTGTDALGRPLCPNQIEQLEREMILEGVGFAAGMLGGGLGAKMAGAARSAGLLNGLLENSGRFGNKGSGVYIGEANSGVTPRGGIEPPGIGSSSKPSVGPRCTGGACDGPNCFPAGTPISVDSAQRPIEEIKTGDTVLAMDPTTRALTRSRVAQTFVRLATSFVMVFAGGDSIASTSEHPYWTSQQGWTGAKDLRTGDSLWLPTRGQLLAIDSVRSFKTAPTKVFNFEVEGVHNYLVGALGIAVHNSCTQPEAGGGVTRVRHYTNRKGLNGIKEDVVIRARDNNRVYLEPASKKPLSPLDAQEKFQLRPGKGRDYIETDVPNSSIEWVKNPRYGADELTVRGDLPLLNPDFYPRR